MPHGTRAAAMLIGISPETLLSWERRYGFPRPDRCGSGKRLYSEQLIGVLREARVQRDSGMAMRDVLDRASQRLSAGVTRPQGEVPPAVLSDVLEQLDTSVVVMSGPEFTIELANDAHRRLYPGRQIVGRAATETLTHSAAYLDLDKVFRQVFDTGVTLTAARQELPMYGELRSWNLSYSRLPVRPDEPVRLLLQARDVTDAVNSENIAGRLAEESARVAESNREASEAFDILARITERILHHPGPGLEVLTPLQIGLGAVSVSAWTLDHDQWRCTATSDRTGRKFRRSIPVSNAPFSEAGLGEDIVQIESGEAREASDPFDEHSGLTLIGISPRTSPSPRRILMIEHQVPKAMSENGIRLLRAVAQLLQMSD